MEKIYTTNSPEETEAVGKMLAEELLLHAPQGALIAMEGEMGVGKTALVRGFCERLGIRGAKSPTYTIVNEYPARIPVYHFDMYRIDDEDSLYSIGYYDYLESGGICFAEWCEKIEPYLPEAYYTVTIRKCADDPDKRIITIQDTNR